VDEYLPDNRWYAVSYEDGDSEELTEAELVRLVKATEKRVDAGDILLQINAGTRFHLLQQCRQQRHILLCQDAKPHSLPHSQEAKPHALPQP